jgi:hypothetical protein
LRKARGLLSRMEAERVNTPVDGPSRVKGLPDSIDPNKPPSNYRDAMRREDRQEWAEAYDKEYQGSLNKEHSKSLDQRKGLKCWTPPRVLITRR